MAGTMTFVVRPLPGAGIDGCFRIHLAPDSLEKLGLHLGDTCIVTDEHGTTGAAIAWRATDQMGTSPKTKPAKMSEPLRSILGLKEGSNVTISKSNDSILHADQVTLTEITSSTAESTTPDGDLKWRSRCQYSMVNFEAIAQNLTFDVAGKKGVKRRFRIKNVRTGSAKSETAVLYYCDDETTVTFGKDDDSSADTVNTNASIQLGGMDQQINYIRVRLKYLTDRSPGFPQSIPRNQHILVHGYEGTGKTALLNYVDSWNLCPTFRVELAPNTRTANQTIMERTFKKALELQPSIILIDNLDHLASPTDEASAIALERELSKLRDSTVIVIAAARSVLGIHSSLHAPDQFSLLLELPVPDIATRRRIFNVCRGLQPNDENPITENVSAKTHGFTARDLAMLHRLAADNALTRWFESTAPSSGSTEVDYSEKLNALPTTYEALQVEPEDYTSALLQIRPTALREVFFEKPKTKWTDIGGSESMRTRFDEIIGWPLKHGELLKQYDIRPTKGVLLYGPSGCSKTLTAQAVASSYDLNFIAIKGAELISMYVGESERAVREVFRKARRAAPCVVFFDEIDSIGSERSGSSAKDLNVLTTLLNEMDGFDEMKGVTVLAATNKPESLDPALMRPGRFDLHIYVGLPTASARQDILEIALKAFPIASDVDLTRLVEQTEGYSGAEIVNICEVAKRAATRRRIQLEDGNAAVTSEDFQVALSEVAKGVTSAMLEDYAAFQGRAA